MQDYQMFTIIGANIAVLMSFMGISIALIIHMNKRIDSVVEKRVHVTHESGKRRAGRPKKEAEE